MGKDQRARGRSRRALRFVTMAEHLIAVRRRLYEQDHDPLQAWEAYFIVDWSQGRVQMPEWVAAYMRRVAKGFVAINRKEPVGTKLTAAVLEALEITGRGRGAVFARRQALRDRQQLALDVMVLRARGHKAYQAFELVAALHRVNPKTVERAYQRVKGTGPPLMSPAGWERPEPSANLPP